MQYLDSNYLHRGDNSCGVPGGSCSVAVLNQASLPPPLFYILNRVQIRQGKLALASLSRELLIPARQHRTALIACN